MDLKQLFKDMEEGLIYDDLDYGQLVKDIEPKELIKAILDNIGSTNSLVRENVCYMPTYMVYYDLISLEDARSVFMALIGDDHLFKGLGTTECDSVFNRAFSSLAIGSLLDQDEDKGFLDEGQFTQTLDKIVEYMHKEVDLRGFVIGKGWAHAVSHGADMLAALVRHPRFTMEQADKILDCVKFQLNCDKKFVDGDETRLANVIPALIEKGLDGDRLKSWIESLLPKITAKIYTDEHYHSLAPLENLRGFLVYLYFILGDDDVSVDLTKFVKEFRSESWQKAHEAN